MEKYFNALMLAYLLIGFVYERGPLCGQYNLALAFPLQVNHSMNGKCRIFHYTFHKHLQPPSFLLSSTHPFVSRWEQS